MSRSNQNTWASDLLASVVVFLVALPLCMGVAIASGVPPALGLITGIVGGIIVGSIAGSPLQVSGPAAGLTVIVWEIVQKHGLEWLGPILIIAGVLQVVAGFIKIGQWFRAISPAVILGMLAGIGILIFSSQFHVLVDDKPRSSGLKNLLSIPESIIKGFTPEKGLPHNEAAFIGILTISILIVWTKFRPARFAMVPGALVAIVVASAIAEIANLPIAYVNVPSNLFEAVRLPNLSLLSGFQDWSLLTTALAVAFVASAETLLSASAVDRMHDGPRTNYDRELVAQGVGNSICGILGALPMTGVIVRSSANVQAGAKSRKSTILHGTWLLAAVMLLPHVLRMIPVSALAGILVFTGYKLIDTKSLKSLAKYGRFPLVIYAATVIGIVVEDLLTGVLIGLALSFVKLIYKMTHLNLRLENNGRGRADLYLEGAATFVRFPKLAQLLETIPPGTELHVHMDKLVHIDHSCLELLRNWSRQQESFGNRTVLDIDRLEERYHRPMVA